MMYCSFKMVIALVLSLVVTAQAASEKGAALSNLAQFAKDNFGSEMAFLKDILGRRWENICANIVANPYEPTITDEQTALRRLIRLLRAAKAHHRNLPQNDILKRPGVISCVDYEMRKIFAVVIYMYTVDAPHPKVFAMMNAFGRQQVGANGKYITQVHSGNLGDYSKYAGLLNLALTFLLNSKKTESTLTTYRGINLDLTCKTCRGVGGKGCYNCNWNKGIDEFNLKNFVTGCQGAGGFTSSTTEKATALHFAAGINKDNPNPHFLLVEFVDTKQGVPIDRYSFLPHEKEVLFHPRTNHVLEGVAITTIYGKKAIHIILRDRKSTDKQEQQRKTIDMFQKIMNGLGVFKPVLPNEL